MSGQPAYTARTDGDRLVFTTSSFRAERRSVLHGEIYNHEFASMLSASVVSGLVYIIISFLYGVKAVDYLLIGIVFVSIFIISRKFVFRGKMLSMVLDRARGIVTISRPGVVGRSSEEIPFGDVVSINVGSRRFQSDNRDAVDFVQKISLQHGSAIPGLGDDEEFVTLSLLLKDGTERMIYAGRIEGTLDGEPAVPLRELRDFLDSGTSVKAGTK